MNDLEITRLCAEAMEYEILACRPGSEELDFSDAVICKELSTFYDPLHDDAQAMALVKQFSLSIQPPQYAGVWHVWRHPKPNFTGESLDLNRAICKCIANMQKAI